MSSYKFTSPAVVAKLRERHGMSESEAKQAVGLVLDSIANLLEQPDAQVRIGKFGSFTNKLQPARSLRNPRTGEQMHVAEKYAIKFKQAKGG